MNSINTLFLLQVKDSLLNFLCSALVPELCADITAGAAGYIEFILVAVAAVGAFPNEFSVLVLDD